MCILGLFNSCILSTANGTFIYSTAVFVQFTRKMQNFLQRNKSRVVSSHLQKELFKEFNFWKWAGSNLKKSFYAIWRKFFTSPFETELWTRTRNNFVRELYAKFYNFQSRRVPKSSSLIKSRVSHFFKIFLPIVKKKKKTSKTVWYAPSGQSSILLNLA